MIREYIFCSVIESPQIASRSFCFKTNPGGLGALSGLNFSKAASFDFCSSDCAVARVQPTNPIKKMSFERIVLMRLILGIPPPYVKPPVNAACDEACVHFRGLLVGRSCSVRWNVRAVAVAGRVRAPVPASCAGGARQSFS